MQITLFRESLLLKSFYTDVIEESTKVIHRGNTSIAFSQIPRQLIRIIYAGISIRVDLAADGPGATFKLKHFSDTYKKSNPHYENRVPGTLDLPVY